MDSFELYNRYKIFQENNELYTREERKAIRAEFQQAINLSILNSNVPDIFKKITLYKMNRHLYTPEERKLLREELRKELNRKK